MNYYDGPEDGIVAEWDADTLVPWWKVAPGDWIICPHDGRAEQVVSNEDRPNGRQFITTNAHVLHRLDTHLAELAPGHD